jgi:hypothetical protein
VDISSAAVSRAGFSYLIPADVSPVFFAPEIFLVYYPAPSCDGSALGSETIRPPSPLVQDEWTRVEAPVNIPMAAVSVSFELFFGGSGSSNNRAFVDNALFGDPPLFRDRFEATPMP